MLARRRTRTAGVTRGEDGELGGAIGRRFWRAKASHSGCWKLHRSGRLGPKEPWRLRGFA